jgi:NaMN:DMB phosphoribosyltransferase
MATDLAARTMAMVAITRAIVMQGITPIVAIIIGMVSTMAIVAISIAEKPARRLDQQRTISEGPP